MASASARRPAMTSAMMKCRSLNGRSRSATRPAQTCAIESQRSPTSMPSMARRISMLDALPMSMLSSDGSRPELPVIGIEHVVVALELEIVQRAVPPHVMGEDAALLPGFLVFVDPGDAFLAPALRLQHMRHAMAGPDVVLVDLDRAAAERFRRHELAVLLVRKAAAAEHEAVARHVLAPARHDARHGIAHPRQVAEEEMHGMGEAHRQDVVRMVEQDVVPDPVGLADVAGAPGGQRVDMLASRARWPSRRGSAPWRARPGFAPSDAPAPAAGGNSRAGTGPSPCPGRPRRRPSAAGRRRGPRRERRRRRRRRRRPPPGSPPSWGVRACP